MFNNLYYFFYFCILAGVNLNDFVTLSFNICVLHITYILLDSFLRVFVCFITSGACHVHNVGLRNGRGYVEMTP